MSRTSDDRLCCARCPNKVQVVLTFPTWIQKAQTYVEKICAAEGWDLEARLCPVCRGKAVT